MNIHSLIKSNPNRTNSKLLFGNLSGGDFDQFALKKSLIIEESLFIGPS